MRKGLWLFLLVLAGCSRQPATGLHPVPANVVGNWRWVMQFNNGTFTGSYTGPATGDTLTPQSTGVQETLRLNANGSYAVVDNGRTVKTGLYQSDTLIIPTPINWTGAIVMLGFLQPGLPDSVVNYAVNGDTLVMFPALIVTVGVTHIYVRENQGD